MRLIFTFILCVSCGDYAAAADWPQYRGPSNDGKTPEKVGNFPSGGPRQLWKVPTPDGFSSFAVSQGKALTQIIRAVDQVPREVVIALDADSGKELWMAVLGVPKYGHDGGNAGAGNNTGGDGPRSTPTIAGKRAYVLSSDLLLLCLDLETGNKIWSKDIMKEHAGRNIRWKNAASPLLEGDLLFMAGGGEGEALLAINAQDGKTVWKTQDDKMTHATPVPATIHGERQIIFFTESGLVSVAPKDGTVLWRYRFPFSISTAASPIVAGDIVYCSAGYGVGAAAVKINKTGNAFAVKEIWRKPNQLMNHWSTPVYKDGYLYGMFSFKEYGNGPVKCVQLATGNEIWSKEGFGPGNVILADDRLIALGDAGQLVILEATPQAYREISRFQALTGKCWSTPVLSEGRIYVRSTKEGACFDAASKLTGATP